MDLSVLRRRSLLALGGLLAFTAGAGSMQAAVLSSSATATAALTATVTCNTATGPAGAVNVTIHAFPAPTGTNTITVGFVPNAALRITAPASVILSATGTAGTVSNATGLVFTVSAAAGCASSSSGANSFPVQLTANATNDVNLTVSDTVVAATSALTVVPVTITCSYTASGTNNYVPGAPKTVSVTSAANLGTPFTVIPGTVASGIISPAALPSWLVLGPAAPSGTAGTNAANFTVQAAGSASGSANGCGSFQGTTPTYALPISNLPAPAVTVLITLVQTTTSPLIVTPVPAAPSISITYVKGSGNPGVANVNVTSPSLTNAYFTVNTATLPIWLTVDTTAATVPTGGKAVRFSTTSQTDSLAPGNYSATVDLQVSGYGDAPVVVSLLVTNKAPKLTITSANPMAVSYILGGPTPVTTIVIASSDSPIPYTITFGGALAPQLAAGEQLTGIAYSFGTNIVINYNSLLFSTSAPGTVLTGTVTFTWGNPASVSVVTLNLTVGSPGAAVTSISPATLPTAAPGSVFHVTIIGSGFVGGSDPTLATKVGIVTGSNPATLNLDTNFKVTYNSPANLDLQITVPSLGALGVNGDPSLPFLVSGTGGPVYLGVANGSTTIPTGLATLTIGAGPIIYGVTSSSSFTEVSGGNLPQLAPYDMVSIFGSSFCSSVGTGCTSTQILNAGPDPVYHVFPFALSPDVQPASGTDTRRQLSVTFYPHGTLANGLPAPLLFATNGQINAIVPGAVLAAPTLYDIVVSFGCPLCTPSTVVNSVPFPVNTVATDPGIFTIGSDGQGSAAALANPSYALISSANPAGMRATSSTNSDIIQLYVTGLGVPPSPANSTCAPLLTGTGNYLGLLNTSTTPNASFLTIDGAVMQSVLLASELPPCQYALTHGTQPTATVGGQPATVSYAAFVDDTVAGLYQMNIQLPSSTNTLYPNWPSQSNPLTNLLTPTQLPIFITYGGLTSQAGVMLPVAPRLKMVAAMPSSAIVGQPYTGTITASLGLPAYTFAVTVGVLPAGLTLATSSPVLTISGTPLSNTGGTYNVTVTATDTAAAALTGNVTFTITVAGGLFVTSSAPGPFTGSTFGGAGVSLPTITAIGGTGPYAYVPTVWPTPAFGGSSQAAPAGMTAPGTVTGAFATTGAVPAGTYQVTVTATDSLGTTGFVNFVDTIGLLMAAPSTTNNTTLVAATGGTVATVQVTGFTGTAMACVTAPVIPGLTCAVASDGLATITASAGGLTASQSSSFTITVTDNATAPGAETGTFAVGTSVSITVDPT